MSEEQLLGTLQSLPALDRVSGGGRLGQPEDVVDFVNFLASDASHYITGVVLYMRA